MLFLFLLVLFVVRKDIAFDDPNTEGFCVGFIIAGGVELMIEAMVFGAALAH